MPFESIHQAVYLQVCRSTVQIELEAASYTPCRFVQARVAAKTNRYHVLERLAESPDSAVLINVLQNLACKAPLAQKIAYRMIVMAEESDKFEDIATQCADVWRVLAFHQQVCFEERTTIEGFIEQWDRKPPRPVVDFTTDERNALFTLRKPLTKGHPGVLTPLGWRTYAKHWSPKVRRAVIARKDCPDEILRSLLKDPNWFVYLRAWYRLIIEKSGHTY